MVGIAIVEICPNKASRKLIRRKLRGGFLIRDLERTLRRLARYCAPYLRLPWGRGNGTPDLMTVANSSRHQPVRLTIVFRPLLHGALASRGVMAISRPFFSLVTPGVPAMRKAAYCASLCLAGSVSVQVAQLECLLSASMGIE